MKAGSTSVRFATHRARSRASATLVPLGLAAAIVCAPATAAFAQGTRGTQGSSSRAETQSQRQPTPGRLLVPVTIGVEAAAQAASAAPAEGTFAVQRFARTDAGVAAVGTLTVRVSDSETGALRTVVTQIAVPLARPGSSAGGADTPVGQAAQAVATPSDACTTLNLALGAIDVEILGRTVHLERTAVDITAAAGTNQLGTLLCQIAALLDSDTAPAQLVTALNRLLDLLG